jgi:hypothetical protein
MMRLDETDLTRLLRQRSQTRPPTQLAQRIKDEIPERIAVGAGALLPQPDREHAVAYRQLVILVALLLAALGIALWGLRGMIAGGERAEQQAALARLLARREAVVGPSGAAGWLDPVSRPTAELPLRIDPAPYALARTLIEGGRLPAPELIQPAAFVSALDYGDPAPLTGELAIFADGAVGPAPGAGDHRLVRITMRAADATDHARAIAFSPIAWGARARLAVDPKSVARYRLVGVAPAAARPGGDDAGEDLLPGHRVTVLVELQLSPGAAAGDRVLTVSASWRRSSGAEATLDHTLLARDVAGPRDAAPVSLRLAALAADLAAALAARPAADPAALANVREQAESLAARFPADEGVREIASLAARAAALIQP